MRNGPENSPLDEPEAQRSLLLMSLLAMATGIIAGTGAWAFRMMFSRCSPSGRRGRATIYTNPHSGLVALRKIGIRGYTWLNWIYPFSG